jgi:hypothetical protein
MTMLQDRWQLAAVLFKPFSVRELLTLVHRLVDASNSRAEVVVAE